MVVVLSDFLTKTVANATVIRFVVRLSAGVALYGTYGTNGTHGPISIELFRRIGPTGSHQSHFFEAHRIPSDSIIAIQIEDKGRSYRRPDGQVRNFNPVDRSRF
jgi:hypothetical protein